jgi:hypothetical protein
MDFLTIIAIILFLLGIILILAALFFRQILKEFKVPALKNPIFAIFAGIILVGIGFYGGAYTELEAWVGGFGTTGTADVTDAYQYAEFEITPTATITGGYNVDLSLNSAKTIFTCPAMANTTAHTLVEIDNTTWENPRMHFVLKPIPWGGADADDLATVYFKVDNPDLTIDTSTSGNYYLVTKSGGNRQCIWNDGSTTAYVSGSTTMLLTQSTNVTLDLTINQDSASRIENTYDPVIITFTFYNADWSWSKSYSFSFQLTDTFT